MLRGFSFLIRGAYTKGCSVQIFW